MSTTSNLLVCPGYDLTNVLVSVLNAVPDAVAVAFILFLLDETSVSNVAFAPSATFVEPPENDTCEAAAVNVVSPPKTEEPIPLFNITLSFLNIAGRISPPASVFYIIFVCKCFQA